MSTRMLWTIPRAAIWRCRCGVFNPPDGTWSIYWVDERVPGLGTPMVGRFDGRTGRFYADESFEAGP